MKDRFNIDDAIQHAKEKAEEHKDCECGDWHKQLAVWLEELKTLRKVVK